MSYQFQDTGHLNAAASTHRVVAEVAKEANLEEQGQLEAIDNLLDKLVAVYSKDKDGKYSLVVSGESKHDGARLKIEFVLRKVVLPHENALEGSKAAFPPPEEESKRKEERVTDTRSATAATDIARAADPKAAGGTKLGTTPTQAETKASS